MSKKIISNADKRKQKKLNQAHNDSKNRTDNDIPQNIKLYGKEPTEEEKTRVYFDLMAESGGISR